MTTANYVSFNVLELADKVRVTLIEALPNVLPMFSKVSTVSLGLTFRTERTTSSN